MKDLGRPVNHTPTTDFGQTVRRHQPHRRRPRAPDRRPAHPQGTLNTDGSLQKLLTQGELYDNFNTMAVSANQALGQLKAVLTSFRAFAERVSRDPAAHLPRRCSSAER